MWVLYLVPGEARRGNQIPGTGVKGGCELSCGCRDCNSCPLVLEAGPQLQWQAWGKEEVRDIGERTRAGGTTVSQDQLPGAGPYAEEQMQVDCDDTTLALCGRAAISAWDKVRKQEKGLNCLLTFYRAQEKPSLIFFFFRRLASAVSRKVIRSRSQTNINSIFGF